MAEPRLSSSGEEQDGPVFLWVMARSDPSFVHFYIEKKDRLIHTH